MYLNISIPRFLYLSQSKLQCHLGWSEEKSSMQQVLPQQQIIGGEFHAAGPATATDRGRRVPCSRSCHSNRSQPQEKSFMQQVRPRHQITATGEEFHAADPATASDHSHRKRVSCGRFCDGIRSQPQEKSSMQQVLPRHQITGTGGEFHAAGFATAADHSHRKRVPCSRSCQRSRLVCTSIVVLATKRFPWTQNYR